MHIAELYECSDNKTRARAVCRCSVAGGRLQGDDAVLVARVGQSDCLLVFQLLSWLQAAAFARLRRLSVCLLAVRACCLLPRPPRPTRCQGNKPSKPNGCRLFFSSAALLWLYGSHLLSRGLIHRTGLAVSLWSPRSGNHAAPCAACSLAMNADRSPALRSCCLAHSVQGYLFSS